MVTAVSNWRCVAVSRVFDSRKRIAGIVYKPEGTTSLQTFVYEFSTAGSLFDHARFLLPARAIIQNAASKTQPGAGLRCNPAG